MLKALLIARLFAAMLGQPEESIVCWYQPGNEAHVCRVDTSTTEYSTLGVAFVVYPNGRVNAVAEVFEY